MLMSVVKEEDIVIYYEHIFETSGESYSTDLYQKKTTLTGSYVCSAN